MVILTFKLNWGLFLNIFSDDEVDDTVVNTFLKLIQCLFVKLPSKHLTYVFTYLNNTLNSLQDQYLVCVVCIHKVVKTKQRQITLTIRT